MFKKILDIFCDEPVSLSKRQFIKGAAGLAALTVAGGWTYSSSAKEDELENKIKNGFIYDETFYISTPIVIDIPGVTFLGCRFIALSDMDCMVRIKAELTTIKNSYFESNGFSVSYFVWVESPHNHIDMSHSLSTAIDNANGKPVYIANGTYIIDRYKRSEPPKLESLLFKPFSGTTFA